MAPSSVNQPPRRGRRGLGVGTGGPLGMEHFPAPPNTGDASLQTQGTPGPQSLTPHSAWPADGEQGWRLLPARRQPLPCEDRGRTACPGRIHRCGQVGMQPQVGWTPACGTGWLRQAPINKSPKPVMGLRFLSETLSLAFEMLMSGKKKKSTDVFILRGIHRTPEPTEIHLPTPGEYTEPQSPWKPTCHPRVRACSLQNIAPLETRGPAQREISHKGHVLLWKCPPSVTRGSRGESLGRP